MFEAASNGDGDCFLTANRIIMEEMSGGKLSVPIDNTKPEHWRIVHAIVSGQGKLKGRRYVHAFLLYRDSLVADQSNGNDITLPRKMYYEMGNIDKKLKGGYFEYTIEEAKKKMLASGHHGPWDINESLEELFDMISKKKTRISSAVKKKIK